MSIQPVILEPAAGTALQVLADKVRVLATGADTGGRLEAFEVVGAQNSGPPLHRHPWDETFFILDGEVDVTVGGETVRARPGAFVFAPRNTLHTFRFASATGRFVTVNAGEGAAAFFADLDREVGFPPKSMEAVLEVAARHQVQAPV